jgi:hypothetical protein
MSHNEGPTIAHALLPTTDRERARLERGKQPALSENLSPRIQHLRESEETPRFPPPPVRIEFPSTPNLMAYAPLMMAAFETFRVEFNAHPAMGGQEGQQVKESQSNMWTAEIRSLLDHVIMAYKDIKYPTSQETYLLDELIVLVEQRANMLTLASRPRTFLGTPNDPMVMPQHMPT